MIRTRRKLTWFEVFLKICNRLYQGMKPAPVRRRVDSLRATLQVGDVIALRDIYFERLVPGYWSHVGMYVGDTEEGPDRVIQARGFGVHTLTLKDFLSAKYAVAVRPNLPHEVRKECAKEALQFLDTKYDFIFDFSDVSRLSCTELVYAVYKERLNLQVHTLGLSFFSRPVYLPDDLLKGGFTKVWLSPELEK